MHYITAIIKKKNFNKFVLSQNCPTDPTPSHQLKIVCVTVNHACCCCCYCCRCLCCLCFCVLMNSWLRLSTFPRGRTSGKSRHHLPLRFKFPRPLAREHKYLSHPEARGNVFPGGEQYRLLNEFSARQIPPSPSCVRVDDEGSTESSR